MTLYEILTDTLRQLGRNPDAQTLELWRDRLTRYVNDAVYDIAACVRPRRTDTLAVSDRRADLSTLPCSCVKILSLTQDGAELPFLYGPSSSLIAVPMAHDGQAEICYRYMPAALFDDNETPELPESSHGLIVNYAVARERAAGDAASLQAAQLLFALYNDGKRRLSAHVGEADAYAIRNKL